MVFLKDRSRCRLSDARHFGDAETSPSLGTIEMLEGRMCRRKADCAGMSSAKRQHFTWHRARTGVALMIIKVEPAVYLERDEMHEQLVAEIADIPAAKMHLQMTTAEHKFEL